MSNINTKIICARHHRQACNITANIDHHDATHAFHCSSCMNLRVNFRYMLLRHVWTQAMPMCVVPSLFKAIVHGTVKLQKQVCYAQKTKHETHTKQTQMAANWKKQTNVNWCAMKYDWHMPTPQFDSNSLAESNLMLTIFHGRRPVFLFITYPTSKQNDQTTSLLCVMLYGLMCFVMDYGKTMPSSILNPSEIPSI